MAIEQVMLVVAGFVTVGQLALGFITWYRNRGKQDADEVKIWSDAAKVQIENAIKLADEERERADRLESQLNAAIERMTGYDRRIAALEIDNKLLRNEKAILEKRLDDVETEKDAMEATIRIQEGTIATLRERIKHLEDKE